MKLYHASKVLYVPGQRVLASTKKVADARRAAVESVLRLQKPRGSIDRSEAIFAFDSKVMAIRFGCSEYGEGRFYPYRVSMPNSERHPMMLVDCYAKRMGSSDNAVLQQVVEEYWNPTEEWDVWEYLGPEIIVEHQLETLGCNAAGMALIKVMKDHDRIRRLWFPSRP